MLVESTQPKLCENKLFQAYLTVKLNRGLSLELVPGQVGVVRRLDVVIGQGVVQLVWAHLGFLITRGKVVLVHQEPGMEYKYK